VKRLLTATPGFRQLDAGARKNLAHDMVKIAAYIAAGERGDSTPKRATFSGALAARHPQRQQQQQQQSPQPQPSQQSPYKDSSIRETREGVDAFTDEVTKVNFPKFVADLVHGVFDAIVDSSIKQMNAYADLVKNVAKSVDQYMKDNVTENQARDYLVDKYPNHLELDLQGEGGPKVKPKEGADDSTMPDFFADLGLPNPSPGGAVDQDAVEQQLVPAARKRLAMDRQQLLATMVLMGVNRLIVTDGTLEAAVIFDFHATNSRKQKATSSYQSAYSRRFGGKWTSGYDSDDTSTEFTVESGENASSAAKSASSAENQALVDLKTKLSGKVNLRFKTESFPLEKMTELIQPDLKDKIQANTPAAAAAPKPPSPPLAPPPPPPALPPLPPPAR
jgi:hypothetical protein